MLMRASYRSLCCLSIPRNGDDLQLDSPEEPDRNDPDLIAGLEWILPGETKNVRLLIPIQRIIAVQLCPWKYAVGGPGGKEITWADQGELVLASSPDVPLLSADSLDQRLRRCGSTHAKTRRYLACSVSLLRQCRRVEGGRDPFEKPPAAADWRDPRLKLSKRCVGNSWWAGKRKNLGKAAMLGLKTRRWLVLGSVLVPTLCIVVWSCLFGYMAVIHAKHRIWYEHVEARILALAERRPREIAPSQWGYYIACTWNLHSNLGTAMKFESSARNGFLAEFDSRLNRHVDRGTIDWIWAQ